MQSMQFLAWDTLARRRVDMIGRKDKGDELIAHEFDYSVENQVWRLPTSCLVFMHIVLHPSVICTAY